MDDEVSVSSAGIECSCLGSVIYVNEKENKRFYLAYQVDDLTVKVGDNISVKISEDNNDQNISFGYAQVLAVFENTNTEEVFVEVRWFLLPSDIPSHQRKTVKLGKNELVESDQLDDIAAGAVCEVIEIRGVGIDRNNNLLSNDNIYTCRYMSSNESRGLQKIQMSTTFHRGLEFSYYHQIYRNYLLSININMLNGVSDDDGSDESYITAAVREYILSQSQLGRNTLSNYTTLTSSSSSSNNDTTYDHFSIAAQRLHISVIPDELPCRHDEKRLIEDFIRQGVSQRLLKRSIYISGMPGTGKTATVLSSVNTLRKEVAEGRLDDFHFIEINCLRLKNPVDAYTQLWRGLTGYHVSSKQAIKKLSEYFTSSTADEYHVNQQKVIVCLMDELDYLVTKDLKVIYSFFDYPHSSTTKCPFILLGIANTLDLPDRLSNRVISRTNFGIQRVVFSAYNHDQVKTILVQRLSALQLSGFDAGAVELVSRKTANLGDLRIALKICQMTLEKYRTEILDPMTSQEDKTIPSTPILPKLFPLIGKLIEQYTRTPVIGLMTNCSALEKAILICLVKHRQTLTGGDIVTTTVPIEQKELWEHLKDLLKKIETHQFYSNTATNTNPDVFLQDDNVITLTLPPYFLFQEVLQHLIQMALIGTVTSSTFAALGQGTLRYYAPKHLTYSDLKIALQDDPLKDFIIT